VPLLVYVVGEHDPHVAIGTSAIAVTVNALTNLAAHARTGHVKWNCAIVFALAGIGGAMIGSTLGKAMNGQKLLALFGLMLIALAASMFWKKNTAGIPNVALRWMTAARMAPWLLAYGTGTGALAGFFGIGGGVLIVPGLIAATGHADDFWHRILARLRRRVRPDDGVQLCPLEPRRLAHGGNLYFGGNCRRTFG